MSKTNEHYSMRYTCTMPKEIFKNIKDLEGVSLLSIYDTNMYQHYKDNIQWQESYEKYKEAKDNKKRIESDIEFKISNK